MFFFFYWYADHRELHVLTHSFPTRRSSDLQIEAGAISGIARQRSLEIVERGIGLLEAVLHQRPAIERRGRIVRLPHGLVAGLQRLIERVVPVRSEEHTSELQSLMRISYAVFCLKKKTYKIIHTHSQD